MDFMEEALKEAEAAYEEGEVPVGAVVVKDGEIIGRGHNRRECKKDISSHAEIEALKQAEAALGRWNLDGCSVYVSLEPCLMCAGAIKQSRIMSLHYAAKDPDFGAESKYGLFSAKDGYAPLLVYVGEKENQAKNLLNSFFKSKREHPEK